jgi:23S rRNA pseudouridine1911/1915/1917 synthase
LLAHLADRYRHSTPAEWARRLERGELRLDGQLVRIDRVLRAGEWLAWQRPPWAEPAVPLTFAVLHDDGELLAVAKPSGLPCVPAGGFLEHTLLARVRRLHPGAVPAHRLGRGTSGLVLFGLTGKTRAALAAGFREGAIEKTYRALVAGQPVQDRFPIDVPIGPVPHPTLREVFAACPGGRPASSRVVVLERREARSLVEVSIATGRPHQIRIHLAAAGHPLSGDPLYGPGGLPLADPALPGASGYLLHALRVGLQHPTRGRQLELWCLPPPALRRAGEDLTDR